MIQSSISHAQLNSVKLDSVFAQLDKHDKVMVSVAIAEKGKIIYEKAIGKTDVEKNKKANVYSQYRIGSISKMFTAVMTLQLIEEKKLALDTKLSKYYPSLPNASKITIEQLLSHRSGLENFTSDPEYMKYMEKPITENELIAIFEKGTTEFTPDSTYSYSNTNYVLLTFIIEKVTKSTFVAELQKRIIAKANLSDTKVGGIINTDNNEAISYNFDMGKWVKSTETNMSVPLGAGNIVSTTKDLCTFIEALYDGKFISKTMLTKMSTIREGYGYGMIRLPFYTKWVYGHTGGIDGFQSILGYNADDKMALCILGNGYNYSMNDIAVFLLSAYYKKEYKVPVFDKKIIPLSESKGIVGVYTSSKMGMKIAVKEENGEVTAQASGQGAFPLEKVSDLNYKFEAGGIEITFVKDEDGGIRAFRLKQGGMDLIFDKE